MTALSRQRPAGAVLRVVVNHNGVLSHGEVVYTSGQVRGRFGNWETFVPIVRNLMENEGGE
jgi:hypothetical protein